MGNDNYLVTRSVTTLNRDEAVQLVFMLNGLMYALHNQCILRTKINNVRLMTMNKCQI